MPNNYVNLNMVQQELIAPIMENRIDDPSNPLSGQLYYNMINDRLKVFNGLVFKKLLTEDDITINSKNINVSSIIDLDYIDQTIANSISWTINAISDNTNRIVAKLNAIHDGSNSYDSGLYGIVYVGSANSDLIFSSDLEDNLFKLKCQNLSTSKTYVIKVQREIL